MGSSHEFSIQDGGDSKMHFVLYEAAFKGDWETAKRLFDMNKNAATAGISNLDDTPLHIAVSSGKANEFVKKLVDMLPPEALAIQNTCWDTALHNAAMVGNTEAAKTLVTKNPDLLYILNFSNRLAVLQAVRFRHTDTAHYLLLSMSNPNPFQGQLGLQLLNTAISSQMLDVALDLVDKYPHLAHLKSESTHLTPLSSMANNATLFLSGERFNWRQRWIYNLIPIQQENLKVGDQLTSVAGDAENGISEGSKDFKIFSGVSQLLELLQKVNPLVPSVEEIRKKKAVHQQALVLVKRLCQEMLTLPQTQASEMFNSSITIAAKHGISEIVEVIMEMYPMAIYARDCETGGTIFHLAAKYRFENVFNLLYSLSDRKYQFFDSIDREGNTLMHVCGALAPDDRLNLVTGPALQMQRELQWYNEMKKFVHPCLQTNLNFSKEHKQLKIDGEKWMKDTANACSIAAALISTVMFAAVFTVPGGVDKGVPVFSSDVAFRWFVIYNMGSLIASITSLLTFLSLFTSRYAEEDFLHALPIRLTVGLLTLCISIVCMMIAYCAAMYYVTIKIKHFWLLVAEYASLPVILYVVLHFPLLVELISSTLYPGIFGKKQSPRLVELFCPHIFGKKLDSILY